MQLEEIKTITGVITCQTGLRIGGTKETAGIGETDNPVIRHPVTRFPYIPGSSLKGKLRSLMEMRHSPLAQNTGKPCDCGDCPMCRLFGCGSTKNTKEPGRLIFRDAFMTAETRDKLEGALPGSYVEVKSEIQMNRKLGSTQHGSLRQMERIPEGAQFDFSFSVRLFKEDTASRRQEYLKLLAEAFAMLEQDYLGGCGSRGYGKVKIMSGDKSLADHLRSLTL